MRKPALHPDDFPVETSKTTGSAKTRWCPDGEAVFSESAQATLERARGLARKGDTYFNITGPPSAP